MSALFQGPPPRDANGWLLITNAATVPAYFHNGLPYEADGRLAFEAFGVVDHYHQGLPFTAEGRIAYAGAAPTYFGMGAAPFNTTGIASANAGGGHYSSGVQYGVGGGVSTTTV
jgi:hypothetical protein